MEISPNYEKHFIQRLVIEDDDQGKRTPYFKSV